MIMRATMTCHGDELDLKTCVSMRANSIITFQFTPAFSYFHYSSLSRFYICEFDFFGFLQEN